MSPVLRSRGLAVAGTLILISATLLACGGGSEDSSDTGATSSSTATDSGGAIDPALAAQSLASGFGHQHQLTPEAVDETTVREAFRALAEGSLKP